MMSKRDSSQKENRDDEQSNKDEQVRKDIQIIAARLYDLRERFMKVVDKINRDADGFTDQISDEDDDDDDEDEMSVDEDNNDSTEELNNDNDGKHTEKFLIKCILENKARDCEYLKYIPKYPQIMKYLLNDDDSNSTQISLRYLEPFVKEYVDENPNGKIYDKVTKQLQDIRQNYLKNCL